MTLLELWKSTVTNLAALLGFSSRARSRTAPSPASIAKRSTATSVGVAARKPRGTLDTALDEAAFAAVKTHSAPARENSAPATPETPPAESSWTRQGIVQEQPVMDTPDEAAPVAVAFSNGDEPYSYEHGSNGNGNGGAHGDGDDEVLDDDSVPLTTLLESLLFVASEPVDPRQLAQTLDQPLEIIELGLAELGDYYRRSLRGLRLQRFNNMVQLVTTPAAAPFIEIFLNLDNSTRLSSPALETLAVIAYRQPVTRAQIEAVRGVDCAGVLRSLVQRGLVVEVGRMEGVGRPILYGVTEQFMHHFGLVELGELPPLEETEADRLWAATVIDDADADGTSADAPPA